MTYLWRDIDPQWWIIVKAAAKARNMNLRQFVQDAVGKAADAVDPADGVVTK